MVVSRGGAQSADDGDGLWHTARTIHPVRVGPV